MRYRRRRQAVRLLFAAAVLLGVTAVLLAVPTSTGGPTTAPPVGLDASAESSAADSSSPVVMGVDGTPVRSSAHVGTTHRGAASVGSSSASSSSASSSGETSAADAPARTPGPTTAGTSSSSSSSAGSSSFGSTMSGTGGTGRPIDKTRTPPATQTPPSSFPPVTDPAAGLLALINTDRASAGCDALVSDPTLAAVAATHSATMRDLGVVGPDDGSGGSVLDQGAKAGAFAQAADAAAVEAGWMADPTAQATLLDCTLGSVGIGQATGAGAPWWTALFS